MQDGSSNKPPFKRVEMAMTRLPMIPEDKLTEDQRRAVQAVTAGKRGGVRGPFPALLRSPKLCEKAAVLGEMMRFDTSLPDHGP
jgi:4-carboxymuconolactone decarboxylase